MELGKQHQQGPQNSYPISARGLEGFNNIHAVRQEKANGNGKMRIVTHASEQIGGELWHVTHLSWKGWEFAAVMDTWRLVPERASTNPVLQCTN